MALSNIEAVRLMVFDVPRSRFYPLLTDAEYEYFLGVSNNSVPQAAYQAARTLAHYFITLPSKEKYGDVEVWNETAKSYVKFLENLMKDIGASLLIPQSLVPYCAGISMADLTASAADPDNPNIYNYLFQNKSGYRFPVDHPLSYLLVY